MMPFIGVRISWLMLARNSLLARLASIALSRAAQSAFSPSSAVRASTVASSCSWFAQQRQVALLDLVEHLVEAVDQLADLVAAGRLRADVVAALARDDPRDLGQPQQRHRDDALQPVGDRQRQPERAERTPRPTILARPSARSQISR